MWGGSWVEARLLSELRESHRASPGVRNVRGAPAQDVIVRGARLALSPERHLQLLRHKRPCERASPSAEPARTSARCRILCGRLHRARRAGSRAARVRRGVGAFGVMRSWVEAEELGHAKPRRHVDQLVLQRLVVHAKPLEREQPKEQPLELRSVGFLGHIGVLTLPFPPQRARRVQSAPSSHRVGRSACDRLEA